MTSTRHHLAPLRPWLLVVLLLLTTGCRDRDIVTHYGSRSGAGAASVNGTSVFGQMFKDTGRRVRSWRLLSPSLEKADVVVWFPNDLAPPSLDVAVWFDDWLRYSYDEYQYEYKDKVLIIIGRGYDAEEMYWRETQPIAPAKLKIEFARRLRQAKGNSITGASGGGTGDVSDWFTIHKPKKAKPVTTLAGPWAGGVDAKQATIEHSATITPDASFTTKLSDGDGHPLISERVIELTDDWDDEWNDGESKLILIENGSFLLNASLVNHENRKLAGRLVDSIGADAKDVVFLESGASPTISDTDPSMGPPTGFELFRIWPIGALLAQAAAIGLVYALARFPIFGVPRRLKESSLTDFGKHVTALGRLLATTRDRAYASGVLSKYFSEVKND